MSEQWHKNAVLYAVEVESFQDSDGDGRGDFRGLIQRLDYLSDLGITCIWVLPFYPSPDRDNRYDVTDYKDVGRELGTLEDFRQFVNEAHQRGLRVIIDLIAHHTSDQHPWFRAARADSDSPYRDYYVWSPTVPTENQPEPMFPGVEKGVWAYDEVARQYYLHRFYSFQPDLNFVNRAVQEEFLEIARYWLEFGVDGFRIDAANHLFERKGLPGTAIDEPCTFLSELLSVVHEHVPNGVLLGEADVPAGEFARYFCDGNGIQLFLNFIVDSHLFLALARGSAAPVAKSVGELPDIGIEWVNYCRNLDELDLERLTDSEKDEVYQAFAPEDNMRLYGRGIRRRLAPMLGGDTPRLRLAMSANFALPGLPLIVYGDEIGMGDDLTLPERVSVRTPMQWSNEPYAGFTTQGDNPDIPAVISSGEYGYQTVNVATERESADSLLSFMRTLIHVRRDLPHFGNDAGQALPGLDDPVLAFLYRHQSGDLLTLHNFSGTPRQVAARQGTAAIDRTLLSDKSTVAGDDGTVCLGPYGFGWFLLRGEVS